MTPFRRSLLGIIGATAAITAGSVYVARDPAPPPAPEEVSDAVPLAPAPPELEVEENQEAGPAAVEASLGHAGAAPLREAGGPEPAARALAAAAAAALTLVFRDGFASGTSAWSAAVSPRPPLRLLELRDQRVGEWLQLWLRWRLERPAQRVELRVRQLDPKAAGELLAGERYSVATVPSSSSWSNLLEQRDGAAACPCLFSVVEGGATWRAGFRRPSDPPLPPGFESIEAWR